MANNSTKIVVHNPLSDKALAFISSYLRPYHKVLEFSDYEHDEFLGQFTESIISFKDCDVDELKDETFDFIFIDRPDGDTCMMTAIRTLKPGGFLMLNNHKSSLVQHYQY